METLTDIPFSLDAESLIARSHVAPGSDDAENLRSLVELATRNGKPKGAYTVSFIEGIDGDSVRIDGVSFMSRTLARNLRSVERVFPFVATCGHEMDEIFPAKADMLKEFWWDMIKARLLGVAVNHVLEHLHRLFRLGKTAIMQPGSGDATIWPIEQQQDLFSLLGDVEGQVGIRLTDSSLMVPNKTTSGLLFPTETDFQSCEVCYRENCPSRRVPFNKELWEEIQQDYPAQQDN